MNLIIKNAKIVIPEKIFCADIGIEGEKIVAVKKGLKSGNADIIDASGMFVMPGVIDVHTHFQLKAYNSISNDDFENGTKAAACGGVTTIIDYAIPEKNQSLTETITKRISEAENNVCIDYSLHCQIIHWDNQIKKEIKDVIDSGITSFKIFMPATEGWQVDDAGIYNAIKEVSKYSGIVELHAENGSLINSFIEELRQQNKLGIEFFPNSRPNFVEEEAVSRAINLAKFVNGQIYIVHLSTKEALQEIELAQKKGIKVFAETCPQYLVLDNSKFLLPDGYLYATCPPIKTKKDNIALWKGLSKGIIQVIATDSCTFTKEQKNIYNGDFTRVPYGMPGVETMLSIVYSKGVLDNKISLRKFVELVSTSPAKIFGLYPKKGTIKPGSDADICIFNPDKNVVIDYKNLQTNCDWSPYQGMKLKGWAEITISRGKVVAKAGKFVGTKGHGRFVKRRPVRYDRFF